MIIKEIKSNTKKERVIICASATPTPRVYDYSFIYVVSSPLFPEYECIKEIKHPVKTSLKECEKYANELLNNN